MESPDVSESLRKASVPPVAALIRADRILQAVATADEPPTAAGLARNLHLPKSTTLGLCVTLADLGYLERSASGAYTLGPRMFALSRRFAEQFDLSEQFFAVFREMTPPKGSTVILGVRDGRHTVTIAERPGTNNYRFGRRVPAHATAMGKAMLSLLPDAEIENLFRGVRFEVLTDRTVRNFQDLEGELDTVRRQGYAVDDEETALGMVYVGAPIAVSSGHLGLVPVGAVAVSLEKAVTSPQARVEATDYIKRVAAAVSARII